MGHDQSKLETPHISSETAQKGLPLHLNVTYKKSATKVICHLSEPDSEPSYVVNCTRGFWGPMVFHDGGSTDAPVLMTVRDENKMGTKFAITLPESQKEGTESRLESLKWESKIKKERFWFGLEVGHGANRHLERFEWRHSHGAEVKSLGGSKWGWKLVRLGGNADSGASEQREDGIASDGGEIVAIWADATGITLTRIGEFKFTGSGATGELGQSFSLMAVASCMCIWLSTMRTTTAATT